MKIRLLGQILFLCFLMSALTAAQAPQSKVALPMVAAASAPLYPPLARAANVEGVVHVRVITDGRRVTSANAEDGPKVLSEAAESNARTWQFAIHEPTTFTVTYRYRLSTDSGNDPDNPTVILRFPTEVEVIRYPMGSRL